MCTKQNRLFAKLRLATSTMSSVGKEYRRPPTLSTTSCECRQGLSFVQGVAHSSAEPTGVNRMVSAFAISLLRTGRPGPLLTNGTPHKYHNAPGVGAGLNNGFVSLFLVSNDYAGLTGTSTIVPRSLRLHSKVISTLLKILGDSRSFLLFRMFWHLSLPFRHNLQDVLFFDRPKIPLHVLLLAIISQSFLWTERFLCLSLDAISYTIHNDTIVFLYEKNLCNINPASILDEFKLTLQIST